MKWALEPKRFDGGGEYSTPGNIPLESSLYAIYDATTSITPGREGWEEKVRGRKIIETFGEIFAQDRFKYLLAEGINKYAEHLGQQLQLKRQELSTIIPKEKLADLAELIKMLAILKQMVQDLGEGTKMFDAYTKYDEMGMWVVYFTAAKEDDIIRLAYGTYGSESLTPIPTISISVRVNPMTREEQIRSSSYRRTPEEIAIRENYINVHVLLRYAVPRQEVPDTWLKGVNFVKGPGIEIKLYESGYVKVNGMRPSTNKKGRTGMSTTENPILAESHKVDPQLVRTIIAEAIKLLPERKR